MHVLETSGRRSLHPHAPSKAAKTIPAMYWAHEMEKKRKYNARVINIKKATFTPLVFRTSGGLLFYKRIAENIANQSLQR